MKNFRSFVGGAVAASLLIALIASAGAQYAKRPKENSTTFLNVPTGSVSVPSGGMGVMSDKDYIYIFRPNSDHITCISKSSSTNEKPDLYQIQIKP